MGKRRFQTSGDCRRYLASLINRTEDGGMDCATAGKLAYIVSILLKILEQNALEERVAALESALEDARQGRPLTIVK